MKRRVIDVSELPPIAFGPRDPVWWGVVLLVVLEGMMLVLLSIAYADVRERIEPWPPTAMTPEVAWVAMLELALLGASVVPMLRASAAARREDVGGMRRGLAWATVLGILAAGCRWALFEMLPFRWDEHAYGSVVWTSLGVQTVHGITGLCENLFLIAVLSVGPVEQKHRVDVAVSSILWGFVVVGALLVWITVVPVIFAAEVA